MTRAAGDPLTSQAGAPPPPPPLTPSPLQQPPQQQPQQQQHWQHWQQQQQQQPWAMSSYYTKKRERRTDALGNIISSADTIAAAPGWTRAGGQLQLAAQALSAELGTDAAALLEQVAQLHALLPGLEGTLRRMTPAELVRMAARLEEISEQLIELRQLLPTADVASAVAAHPPLLHAPLADVERALGALRQAFPDATQADIDAMVSANGALLDGGESLGRCLAGAAHLFTRPQLMRCLQADPAFLFQFQPLEGQSRGERDDEYLADMWRGM